ncbi:MAG: hypothetical protein K1060chlam2_00804 [Chlamydiae bacterium]|nr:hypothetical protein [Chlamydiota bacterium]
MGLFDKIGDLFNQNDKIETDQHSNSTNPASGLPMNGDNDVAGNPFGTNNQPNGFSDPFSNGF